MAATLPARLADILFGVYLFTLWPAFVPGFHEEFVASKQLTVLCLGVPALLLSILTQRRREVPESALLAHFALAVPLLAGISLWKSPADPAPVATFLFNALAPLIALTAGVSLGRDQAGRRRLLLLLGGSGILVCLVGASRRLFQFPLLLPDRSDVGWASTIGNSNELAEAMAPLAVALVFALPFFSGGRRLLAALSALAALVLVGFSDSRAGWLSVLAGTGAAMAFGLRTPLDKARKRRRAGIALALILVLGLAVMLVPGLQSVRSRALSVLDPEHSTNIVRLELWKGSLRGFQDHALLGFGAGRFAAEFPEYRTAREWTISGSDSIADTAHQEVVHIAAETGLLGLGLLAWLLFLIYRSVRWTPDNQGEEDRSFRKLAFGAFVAFAVLALVRSPLHHPGGTLVAATLLGALTSNQKGRPLSPIVRWSIVGVTTLVLAFGVLDLREDRAVFRARWALLDIRYAVLANDSEVVQKHVAAASEALREVIDPGPFALQGPWRAHRAYRAALVADEIATLRSALLRRRMDRVAASLVGREVTEQLLARALDLEPFHRPSRHFAELRNLARVDEFLNRNMSGDAELLLQRTRGRLQAAVKELPAAPGFRVLLARASAMGRDIGRARDLLKEEARLYDSPPRMLDIATGEIVLRLGTEPTSFGTYLSEPPPSEDGPEIEAARTHLSNEAWAEAYASFLIHLGKHPTDAEALTGIAESGYQTGITSEEARAVANRAVARARLQLALNAEKLGQFDLAERHIQTSLSKDPELLDSWWTKARYAAQGGRVEEAAAALTMLKKGRISSSELRFRVEREPAFSVVLSAAAIQSALSDS